MTAEHLTDGWEPDLPVSDTLVRRFLFNLAAFNELPAVAAGARGAAHRRVRRRRPGPPGGHAQRRHPAAAAALRPARRDPGRGRGVLRRPGQREAFLWSAWPTPDLRQRGWVLEGHPPLLLRPPGGSPPPAVPPGLRVERVTVVDGLGDWERVAVDGFPYRELQPWRPGVAAFSLGVTLPEARRRGYWGAMAGVRLLQEPDLPAVGIFSDLSRPPAEALGFVALTRFTLWHRPRPGPVTPTS